MHEVTSHRNLKGKSFKGQNLTEVSFENADIRGADFTNAVLIGANFSYTKTGREVYWIVCLSVGTLFLLTLAGFILAYASALMIGLPFLENKLEFFVSTLVTLILLFIFIFIMIRRGLGAALGAFSLIIAGAIALLAAVGSNKDAIGAIVVQSIGISSAIAGTLASSIGLVLFWSISRSLIPIAMIVLIASTILGTLVGIGSLSKDSRILALVSTEIVALALVSLSTYVSLRILAADKKYFLVSSVTNMLSALGGTSFRGANLTDANFTEATLKSADFRQANLTRTNWYLAKQLEQARCDRTYLEDESLRQLVVSKDGHGNTYDYKNLQGLNLQAANLTDASFIGADLNEANLQDANFTRAKLVKTRLYGADLTHSCLSGACIQDWAISTDTQLEQVVCTHIYMRLQTKEDPDPWRKPDNRNETFKEGDFTDFIAPIIKTLDLYRQQNVDPRQIASTFKSLDFYHYGGIDPAAAAVALKQLSEENPEAGLEVITLEGRGSEKIRLQAVVTGDANSSQLNAKYFEKYRQISSLPYSDIQALLAGAAEKDERIRSLEKLLGDALQQPKFYVETYQNQGEFIMAQENKGNVNISGVQGNVSGVAAAGENQTMTGVALGAISGNVTNTISQLPDTTDPNEPSLKELLTQLQALIESESELNEDDKVEALEQVKVLAESGQKTEDSTLQKLAKTAVKILKGTIASLPDVTKLVESGTKLLPLITKLLGLP